MEGGDVPAFAALFLGADVASSPHQVGLFHRKPHRRSPPYSNDP
jgi:hypothetical protein